MLSCWHDLLFLFSLLLFYLFLSSMGWFCRVGVFGMIVFSLSTGLAQRTPINNNNNKNDCVIFNLKSYIAKIKESNYISRFITIYIRKK